MSVVDTIETALMESAESGKFDQVIPLLKDVAAGNPVSGLIKSLNDAASLAYDNFSSLGQDALEAALLIASLGSAPAKLRDFFADKARKAFNSYPDPAGLVNAIGCHNNTVEAAKIAGNWQMLCILLAEYADSSITGVKKSSGALYCHTQKFGFGKIIEVDAFGDTVIITFKARQSLPLEKFVSVSNMVVPGSKAFDLLEGKKFDHKAILATDLSKELELCMVPPMKFTQAVITRIVMPTYIKSVKAFESWYNRKSLVAADKPTVAGERNWGNSRSLAELNEHLPSVQIKPDEDQHANLAKIFGFAANKPLQVQLYSELLCILWDLCKSDSIKDIVTATADEAVVWSSNENFVTVTDKMGAKHLNSWFDVTLQAKGPEWLVHNCLDLPLKFWNYMEKALESVGQIGNLVDAVRRQVKTGKISADPIMWLWNRFKNKQEEIYSVIGNPSLIIRTLTRDTRGNYIKAAKELRKLICENEEFQKFLMNQGEESAISALVSATRSMAGLDSGEKQSLLIRIVRIYPSAKHLVEERKVKMVEATMEKVTSIRSFKERQAELQDIINVQMPQNRDNIATAAEHGDFRENFEFHAAKRHKALLEARRGELEQMLSEVKPTDFSEYEVKDRVIIGSVVNLDTDGDKSAYTILGMWDSDPDKKYISPETPLGKSLMGHRVGDSIKLPNGKEAEIISVEPLPKDLKKSLGK